MRGGLLAVAEDREAPVAGRASASVATALAAAVRIAVTSPAWTTQTGAPVSGSNRTTRPWCDCRPLAKFSGKTLISLAPNGAASPIAPGMIPKARPWASGMIERRCWRVTPFEKAIIASRTMGIATS